MYIEETAEQLRYLRQDYMPGTQGYLRLDLLLRIWAHGHSRYTTIELATEMGVDPTDIGQWRSAYMRGGLEELMSHQINKPQRLHRVLKSAAPRAKCPEGLAPRAKESADLALGAQGSKSLALRAKGPGIALEIAEGTEELARLLRGHNPRGQAYHKIYMLQLIHGGRASCLEELERLTGMGAVLLNVWLEAYTAGGLRGLLSVGLYNPGNPDEPLIYKEPSTIIRGIKGRQGLMRPANMLLQGALCE